MKIQRMTQTGVASIALLFAVGVGVAVTNINAIRFSKPVVAGLLTGMGVGGFKLAQNHGPTVLYEVPTAPVATGPIDHLTTLDAIPVTIVYTCGTKGSA